LAPANIRQYKIFSISLEQADLILQKPYSEPILKDEQIDFSIVE